MINMTTEIIHGYGAGRLSADERNSTLIRRPWTRKERNIVLSGFFGRLTIGFEPLLCGIMFLALTIGMLYVHTDPQHPNDRNLVILAPIFGLGVLACIAYFVGVMLAPTRALVHTLRPIFIVDGYVRYRAPDDHSPVDSNGYVAVLTEAKSVACEWPTLGEIPLRGAMHAALCEFSVFGGVHRIDGRSTGVLPDSMATFGVGIRSRREIIP